MAYKKFRDIQAGDLLYCATLFGTVCRSRVWDALHTKRQSKISFSFVNGVKNFNPDDSCKEYAGAFHRYIATTKEELALLMNNGVGELEVNIDRLQRQLEDLRSSIRSVNDNTEENIPIKD